MNRSNICVAVLFAFALHSCASADNPTRADREIVLSAENGKPLGPNIKYMPEWKAVGWFTAKDSVEWNVEIEEAGKYDVYLEWSVSDEEAGKEFIMTAGGDQLIGAVAKSGSWETFRKEHVGSITLDEGPQKIVFKSKTQFDDGALLDFRQVTLMSQRP